VPALVVTVILPELPPVGAVTTRLVALALLTVALLPLNFTVLPATVALKLLPEMVTEVPAVPVLGLMPLIVGNGAVGVGLFLAQPARNKTYIRTAPIIEFFIKVFL
jgi:hypothetical protein